MGCCSTEAQIFQASKDAKRNQWKREEKNGCSFVWLQDDAGAVAFQNAIPPSKLDAYFYRTPTPNHVEFGCIFFSLLHRTSTHYWVIKRIECQIVSETITRPQKVYVCIVIRIIKAQHDIFSRKAFLVCLFVCSFWFFWLHRRQRPHTKIYFELFRRPGLCIAKSPNNDFESFSSIWAIIEKLCAVTHMWHVWSYLNTATSEWTIIWWSVSLHEPQSDTSNAHEKRETNILVSSLENGR